MIQNFEEVRKQLRELSEVINSYKSEAVQLRLLELVFGKAALGVAPAPDAPAPNAGQPAPRRRASRRRVKNKGGERAADAAPSSDGETAPKAKAGGRKGTGAKSTLADLYEENFFSTPKTLGAIVAHCDHNLARKYRSNEFSGALARYVRDKKLKRSKNADNQYEYTNAN